MKWLNDAIVRWWWWYLMRLSTNQLNLCLNAMMMCMHVVDLGVMLCLPVCCCDVAVLYSMLLWCCSALQYATVCDVMRFSAVSSSFRDQGYQKGAKMAVFTRKFCTFPINPKKEWRRGSRISWVYFQCLFSSVTLQCLFSVSCCSALQCFSASTLFLFLLF